MLSQIVSSPRAVRTTWIVWGVFLLAACVVLVRSSDRRPANDAYARGGARWLAGRDLYDEGGTGFIYLPQSAVLYAPLTFLPKSVQHIVWRMTTIGLFAAGIRCLCRLAGHETGVELFPMVSLLVLPKTWTCALNGQATPAMAGLSMIALTAIYQKRWGRAAALLTAALAFKPLAIVFILLAGAVYRPLAIRLVLGIAGFFAAPYLLQENGYVTNQYLASIDMLDKAAQLGLGREWAQLFSLGGLAGIDLSPAWQTALRLAAALATLALCREACQNREIVPGKELKIVNCKLKIAKWFSVLPVSCSREPTPSKSEIRNPKSEITACGLIGVYALATVYLLLFNPRTENNSYLMLSPVIGLLCARAQFVERQPARAAWLGAGSLALVAGHEICGILTPQAGFVWVCPFVCLLFAVALVRDQIQPGRLDVL